MNHAGIVNDPSGLTDIEARAAVYINASIGQSGLAVVLQASKPSNYPTTGYQDLIAPSSLNFFNAPKASPSINTAAGGTIIVGSGSKLTDTAVLSGGNSPTGSITFKLTAPGGSVVDTETVSVSGDGTYSTPTGYVPTAPGTYVWSATYSGDSNNKSATDNGQNESEAVNSARPAINTTAGGKVIIGSGSTLTDTAVLSGGFNPTGSITFKLTAPGGSVVDTETVNVSGNGTYSTTTGYVPTAHRHLRLVGHLQRRHQQRLRHRQRR